jgi:hypothetical protein
VLNDRSSRYSDEPAEELTPLIDHATRCFRHALVDDKWTDLIQFISFIAQKRLLGGFTLSVFGHIAARFPALRLEVDLQRRIDERKAAVSRPDLMRDPGQVQSSVADPDSNCYRLRSDLVGSSCQAFQAEGVRPLQRLTLQNLPRHHYCSAKLLLGCINILITLAFTFFAVEDESEVICQNEPLHGGL